MMPCDQWRQRLIATAKSDIDQALHPLLDLFSDKIPFEEQDPCYDCENTLESLASMSLSFPQNTRSSLTAYFRYFEQIGYV